MPVINYQVCIKRDRLTAPRMANTVIAGEALSPGAFPAMMKKRPSDYVLPSECRS